MLRKQAEGSDYFVDLGNFARIAATIVLAPFALYFTVAALLTPIAAVCLAFQRDWQIAGILLGAALFHALLAVPLCWITLRLYHGQRAANGVTVLPTWLIRTFLLAFLGPLSVGLIVGMSALSFQAAMNGDVRQASILAAGACGFAVSLARAIYVATRSGIWKRTEGDSPPAASDSSSQRGDEA